MQIQVPNPTNGYLLALINDCEGFANGANPVKPQPRDAFIYNIINRLKVIHKLITSPSPISNPMARLKNAVPHTMSSREIARITGKQHKHVIRDIQNMLTSLDSGNGPNLDHGQASFIYDDRKYISEILLPKDLTLTLVSGYNVKMRHAIVKRWMELEGDATSQTESFYEKSIFSGALTLFPSPEGENPQLLKIREACKMLDMNQNEFSNLIISHGFATRDEKRRLIPTKRGIKEKIVVHFHYKGSGATATRIPLKSIIFIKKLPFLLG